MPFQRSAVVFDLDGTLVDTADDLAWALNEVLTGLGRPAVTVADVRGMIGGGVPQLVQLGLEHTGGPLPPADFDTAVAKAKSLYNEHVADHSRPYPGVKDALASLAEAGVRMGVCTNKPEAASRRLLAAVGLDPWLPVIVGGDTLPVKKPDPAMVHAVLDRMPCAAKEAIIVGDSATDVALARAAGVPVVLVNYGYTHEPADTLGADAVIAGFGEIAGQLSALS